MIEAFLNSRTNCPLLITPYFYSFIKLENFKINTPIEEVTPIRYMKISLPCSEISKVKKLYNYGIRVGSDRIHEGVNGVQEQVLQCLSLQAKITLIVHSAETLERQTEVCNLFKYYTSPFTWEGESGKKSPWSDFEFPKCILLGDVGPTQKVVYKYNEEFNYVQGEMQNMDTQDWLIYE